MEKKNIMFLIGSLSQGGAERQVVELAKGLPKSQFNIFIVIYRDKIHYKEILKERGVKVKLIEKKRKVSLKFIYELYEFIKQNKIAIIHSYMINTNFWARIIALLSNTKVITSIRCIKTPKHYYILENFINFIDRYTIFNSKSALEEYKKNVHLKNNNKLKVIYNGVNLQYFSKYLKKKLNENKRKIIIGIIGRISLEKNHLCYVKALNLLDEKYKKRISTIFLGRVENNKLYKDLKKYIDYSQLDIYFMNPIININKFYNKIDLIVLPSLYEGFPNVILEAMASSLPVIASDVSDNPLLIKNGINGYLFRNNDHIELCNYLKKFMDLTSVKKRKMGEMGYEYVKKFSTENLIKNNIELYKNVLGNLKK